VIELKRRREVKRRGEKRKEKKDLIEVIGFLLLL
jgi:hypothetical protein